MRLNPYKFNCRWNEVSFVWRKYCGSISETNRSVSLTEKASPAGNHETTAESSFLSISINFRGKGFAPDVEPAGDAVAEREGEGARLLPALAVRVILRVAIGPSDISLNFEVDTVLEGDVLAPAGKGLTLITPAATPPARGKITAPEPAVEGVVEEVLFGAFLAFS